MATHAGMSTYRCILTSPDPGHGSKQPQGSKRGPSKDPYDQQASKLPVCIATTDSAEGCYFLLFPVKKNASFVHSCENDEALPVVAFKYTTKNTIVVS
jgi:hypothetical protein